MVDLNWRKGRRSTFDHHLFGWLWHVILDVAAKFGGDFKIFFFVHPNCWGDDGNLRLKDSTCNLCFNCEVVSQTWLVGMAGSPWVPGDGCWGWCISHWGSPPKKNLPNHLVVTLPETNMEPEKGWFPSSESPLFGGGHFFKFHVSFREVYRVWKDLDTINEISKVGLKPKCQWKEMYV